MPYIYEFVVGKIGSVFFVYEREPFFPFPEEKLIYFDMEVFNLD